MTPLYSGVYSTPMDNHRTTEQGGQVMRELRISEGMVVEVTRKVANYVTIPAGTRGIVRSIGPSHSTMNGGGRDCSLELLDPEFAAEYAEAVGARLRELQATDTSGFYTDRYIAHVQGRISVNDNNLRAVV